MKAASPGRNLPGADAPRPALHCRRTTTEATLTWSTWPALLRVVAGSFTRRGYRRFVEWVTAMALKVGEHTITQSALALDQPAWKALENLAKYGGWHEGRVT